ncbi:uncharacterized protein CC84DRAFT_1164437 [Paraphaeosphaeria sporulosa]|uniref:Uncharacterized protein n=1 Tax=Paraphaeosphaeria sporulosa TaxID=1460663 RepID=A0A177CFF8_9PLEO|nr:uncharacterized protein CC84DRAFT_1164437 [Paraphaeosphaeria sporulosa]OAG06076.1 hypothetical protein CC84DRAFT_1164437 [Paraphaeosphaeria sporulosa]
MDSSQRNSTHEDIDGGWELEDGKSTVCSQIADLPLIVVGEIVGVLRAKGIEELNFSQSQRSTFYPPLLGYKHRFQTQ